MLTLLLMVYGALLFAIWAWLVTWHPTIGVAGVAGVVLMRASGLESPRLAVVADVDLYAADGVFAGLAVAAVVAIVAQRPCPATPGRLGLWLFIAGTAASMLRGLAGGELATVGNEARVSFYVLTGLAFVRYALRDPRSLSRSIRVWGVLTLMLVVGVVAVIAVEGPGTSQGFMLSTGEYVDTRAVDAASALLVAQGAWVAVLLLGRERSRGFACLICMGLVVVLQHRSVWVAALGAGLFTLVTSQAVRAQVVRWTPLLSVLSPVLLLLSLAGPLLPLIEALKFSAESAFAERSTVTWRTTSWSLLLAGVPTFGPLDVLFGLPMGSGFARVMDGRAVDVSPHNLYVQTFLRGGLVALVGLVLLLVPAVVRSGWAPSRHQLVARGLLLTLALFFVAYGAAPEQGLVLGLALRLLAAPNEPETVAAAPRRPVTEGAR